MDCEEGQAVIWAIVIMLVALVLGVSLAMQSISQISQTEELERSNQAFSAAEAGIEQALYVLESSGATTSSLTPTPLPNVESEFTYEVTGGGDGPEVYWSDSLAKEEVIQVDCSNMTGNLRVYWVRENTNQDQDGNRASLLITIISQEASNDYEVTRAAYNPSEEHAARANGFTVANTTGRPYSIDGVGFLQRTPLITLPGTGGKPKVMRITALYNGVPNEIGFAAETDSFPTQYYVITSTGTAGDAERKIQVRRSKSDLLPFFDYSLMDLSAASLSK